VIREHKLSVPNDMSIVGYDDSFLADVSEVKLTTIKHPQSELGERAGKLILDMIQKSNENNIVEEHQSQSVIFEPNLIRRNSTKQI